MFPIRKTIEQKLDATEAIGQKPGATTAAKDRR